MITVCHIITKLELGGAQQNTLYTIRRLDRTRFRPLLITGPEGLLRTQAEAIRDVPQYYLPHFIREIHPAYDLVTLWRLWRILRQERRMQRDILVHTHSSKAGVLGRWAAKLAGVPVILHSIHGFGFHPHQSALQRRVFMTAEKLTARITTHFIAVSRANITTGIRAGLFDASRVSLIRSGIELDHFRPPFRSDSDAQQHRRSMLKTLRIPEHKAIVGMIACFKPQKAPLDFVRAMKIVSEQFPDVHALMVGDGELRPHIEAVIAKKGLEHTITLLGWRTDIPALLHLFDVLVLTSLWEGLPRVCPQAMAAGLPVVATRVDGTPEAIQDGLNGLLAEPGDVQGIAAHILFLLTHPDRAQDMGRQGQQRVEEFDSHLMVRQQEELYETLMRCHASGEVIA